MSFEPFDELAGSPVFVQQGTHARATRMGKMQWSDITDFANYLFPVGLSPRSFPNRPTLLARALHAEPFIGDNEKLTGQTDNDNYEDEASYSLARVRIEYETALIDPTQGDDPVSLLRHRWSISGEVIKAAPGGFVWDDDGKVDDEASPGIFIPMIEHQITWPQVKKPPFSVIRDRMGTVNDGNLTFNTGLILPETLLFTGAELQRDILTTGALAWEVSYRFSERRVKEAETGEPGGWNHFYRSEDENNARLEGKTGFYRMKVAADRPNAGDPVFRLADHDALFQEAT